MPFTDTHWLAVRSHEVANHTGAMLGYWDKNLVCRYANQAYQQWFGITPEQLIDRMTMKQLLGSLFEKNLPYIHAALGGRQQVFEREIVLPTGEIKTSIATYYPHVEDGAVEGFFVHVADITMVKSKHAPAELPAAERKCGPLACTGSDITLPEQIAETLRGHIFGRFPGISALARKHFLSPTKLKTVFKKHYKIPPFVFYRNMQMELAEQYLADKSYSKKHVAALFRFTSTANFTDCFNAYQVRKSISGRAPAANEK